MDYGMTTAGQQIRWSVGRSMFYGSHVYSYLYLVTLLFSKLLFSCRFDLQGLFWNIYKRSAYLRREKLEDNNNGVVKTDEFLVVLLALFLLRLYKLSLKVKLRQNLRFSLIRMMNVKIGRLQT